MRNRFLEATVQVVELPKDFILAMLKISNQDWPDRWSIVHSRMLRGGFCGGRKVCWLVDDPPRASANSPSLIGIALRADSAATRLAGQSGKAGQRVAGAVSRVLGLEPMLSRPGVCHRLPRVLTGFCGCGMDSIAGRSVNCWVPDAPKRGVTVVERNILSSRKKENLWLS